uniref:Ig-like domain-containing protein n=1 Tax=Xiphophorus maculatus TaxID=8083 RepID=A0A3B5QME7_XIPMA
MFNLCIGIIILVFLPSGVESQQLSPLMAENFISEGGSVSLTYTFSKEATGSDEFYWYRQHPGKPPEFLLYHLGSGKILSEQTAGREIDVKGRDIKLLISSAAVTDSAVYYCAVSNKKLVTGTVG